ncbi:MAG: hypothetical protein LCH92_08320 [Proteobacteria bacterium]|nr:hypothetical protein [Pseudomonadota bacterium]
MIRQRDILAIVAIDEAGPVIAAPEPVFRSCRSALPGPSVSAAREGRAIAARFDYDVSRVRTYVAVVGAVAERACR